MAQASHRYLALPATLLALAGLAAASPPAQADTRLSLSATGTVSVMPDELVAALTASADGPSAAEAQARVNAMVAQALASTKPLKDATVSTTGYSVWHQTDPKDLWHASQGIALRSHDGAALLGLIGTLQAQGLGVDNLSWQLSPALAEKSYDEAMTRAIEKLGRDADRAAALLHLTRHGFTKVSLGDNPENAPRPLMRMMATMAAPAPAAPPPMAQAEAVTVSATVSGEAKLEDGP